MNGKLPFSWIDCHLLMRGNVFLCKVGKYYIRDSFNLTDLPDQVPHFCQALKRILDGEDTFIESSDAIEMCSKEDDEIEKAAQLLYGLIHARYILTARGIEQMIKKYNGRIFGSCPRVYCEGQTLLPLGLIDIPGKETVKLYCPKCVDVYVPKRKLNQNLDGAYFGTGFPHMLLMMHPMYRPEKPKKYFTPNLYDSQINKMSLDQLQAPESEAGKSKTSLQEI